MGEVLKRAAAKRDLVDHFVYLAEHADLETADRFLRCAQESFADLARYPEMGAPLSIGGPELAGIRKWHVREFEKFLVFYQPRRRGVSIVRVLHAAQDWWGMLGLM